MNQANNEIRQLCKEKHVPLWLLADRLGIADQTLYRKLRHTLPEEERQRAIEAIAQISEEHETVTA